MEKNKCEKYKPTHLKLYSMKQIIASYKMAHVVRVISVFSSFLPFEMPQVMCSGKLSSFPRVPWKSLYQKPQQKDISTCQ